MALFPAASSALFPSAASSAVIVGDQQATDWLTNLSAPRLQPVAPAQQPQPPTSASTAMDVSSENGDDSDDDEAKHRKPARAKAKPRIENGEWTGDILPRAVASAAGGSLSDEYFDDLEGESKEEKEREQQLAKLRAAGLSEQEALARHAQELVSKEAQKRAHLSELLSIRQREKAKEKDDGGKHSKKHKKKKDSKKDKHKSKSKSKRRHSDSDSDSDEKRRKSKRAKKEEAKQRRQHERHLMETGGHPPQEEAVEESKGPRVLSDKEKILEIERRLVFDDTRKSNALWMKPDASLSGVASEDMFAIDATGDTNNAVFESLYRLDVPSYRRLNGGSVLIGSALSKKAARVVLAVRGPGQPEPPLNAHALAADGGEKYHKSTRYFAEKHVLRDRDKFGDDTLKKGDVRLALPLEEFVSLSITPKSEPSEREKKDREKDKDDMDASDSEGEQDQEEGQTFSEWVYDKTKEFNVRTRQQPKDVDLWFKFVDFQDESAQVHRGSIAAPVLEKKIAILEKGMEHNPDNEQLVLAYLHTAQKYWPPDRLSAAWEKMMVKHSDSPRLWKEYVLFRQSQFSNFSVSNARAVYTQAIKTLSAERERLSALVASAAAAIDVQSGLVKPAGAAAMFGSAMGSELKDRDRQEREQRRAAHRAAVERLRACEETLLAIFIRAATFTKQAGFAEKALAMFQALIEFNLFRPPTDKLPKKRTLVAFEAFWDSDAPRVGEPASQTWRVWFETMQAREQTKQPQAQTAAAAKTPTAAEPLLVQGSLLELKARTARLHELHRRVEQRASERAAWQEKVAKENEHITLDLEGSRDYAQRQKDKANEKESTARAAVEGAARVARWVATEESVSRFRWRPLLEKDDDGEENKEGKPRMELSAKAADELFEGLEQPVAENESESVERVVLFDDVKGFLFELNDSALRHELVLACLESEQLLGASSALAHIGAGLLAGTRRISSNSEYAREKAHEMESFDAARVAGLTGSQTVVDVFSLIRQPMIPFFGFSLGTAAPAQSPTDATPAAVSASSSDADSATTVAPAAAPLGLPDPALRWLMLPVPAAGLDCSDLSGHDGCSTDDAHSQLHRLNYTDAIPDSYSAAADAIGSQTPSAAAPSALPRTQNRILSMSLAPLAALDAEKVAFIRTLLAQTIDNTAVFPPLSAATAQSSASLSAPATSLRCLSLAFEAALSLSFADDKPNESNLEHVRTLAKGFLKADPSNLRLWNAYAQVELAHGVIKEARKVYTRSLSLAPQLPAGPATRDVPLLFWCYSFTEIQQALIETLTAPVVVVPPAVASAQFAQFGAASSAPQATPGSEYGSFALPLHVLLSAGELGVSPFVSYNPSSPACSLRATRLARARKLFIDILSQGPKVKSTQRVSSSVASVAASAFAQGIGLQLEDEKKSAKEKKSKWDVAAKPEETKEQPAQKPAAFTFPPTDPHSNPWFVPPSHSLPFSPMACTALCFAWVEYLTNGLVAAGRVFDDFIWPAAVKVPSRQSSEAKDEKEKSAPFLAWGYEHGGAQHEWLMTMWLRLVFTHAAISSASAPTSTTATTPAAKRGVKKARALPPRVLRDVVSQALEDFPANPLFLSLFVETESRSQLSARLRRHFDAQLSPKVDEQEPSPIIWLHAIASELRRPYTGPSHARLERLFERAIQTPARSFVALWRLYFLYLLSPLRQGLRASPTSSQFALADLVSAHKVFVRAVHQCPWSKTLWLDGIRCLAAGALPSSLRWNAFRGQQPTPQVKQEEKSSKEGTDGKEHKDSAQSTNDSGQNALAPGVRLCELPLSERDVRELLFTMSEKEIRVHVEFAE